MQTLQVTTKSRAQIAAEFRAVFSTIKPASENRPPTHADRLAPYRKQILKQRRRGFSWKQIATAMAGPPINESVTEKLLIKLFGGDAWRKKRVKTVSEPAQTPSENVARSAL